MSTYTPPDKIEIYAAAWENASAFVERGAEIVSEHARGAQGDSNA